MAQISKHGNGTGVVSHSSCCPPAVIWASPTPGTLQASRQVYGQIHQHHPSWLPVSAGRRTANLLFHQGWDCLFHQRTPPNLRALRSILMGCQWDLLPRSSDLGSDDHCRRNVCVNNLPGVWSCCLPPPPQALCLLRHLHLCLPQQRTVK